MQLIDRKCLLIIIMIIGFTVSSFGALTVTTATGGTNISADKAANASSPAWTTLGNIVLTESAKGDFPTSLTSFVINAPTGWSFNTTGVSTTVTGDNQQNLTVNSITPTSSSITFSVTVDKTNKTDILTISGIQVRATNGATLPSNANLTWGSAWLDPLWNGYPLGALSQEVGVVQNFAVEREWGGNIGTQNATVPFNVRITARDQFNNTCNAGSNVFNGTASMTSTGTLSAGATTGNFTNGVIVHSVTISNGGNFTLTATSGAATGTSNTFLVNNPPPAVSLSANTTSIAEDGGVATLTVTLSNTYYQNVGVNINIDAGNSTAGGGEYTLASYYLTVTAGNLTATTTITANDDSNYEGDETVTVEITGVSPGTENGTQFVTITILDDELPPPTVSLSIDHPTIAENGGVATVTVTLSNTYGQTVGVNLDPTGGTAGGGDYSFTPWYVSIAPGNLTATATITGSNDFVSDPNETVGVFITTVTNGSEDGVQIVYTTIIDDDTPGITVAPVSGLETTENGSTATFDVVLNTLPTDDVILTLYSDDTGEGTISPSTLTFTDLDWDTPQTVTITGIPDYVVDGDASFSIVTNAATSSDLDYDAFNPADVSVTNIDNGLSPMVSFTSASQTSAGESGTMTITAELNMVLAVDVTVPYTVNGSSTATGGGTDYGITASPVIITAGNTTADITITIATDALDENNETVIVDMGTPTNAAQGATVQHTATITDDDPQPSVAFALASQSSTGESGTLDITVELSGSSGFDVTIPFTVNGSSTATGSGTDYSSTASPVTITAGNTTATITITITTDTDIEGDETVVLDMGTPVNATTGGITTHTASILDDDFPAQVIQVSSNEICIGDQLTFTAVLSGNVACDEIVRYEASDDGGSNWSTIIDPPGTTCSELYTPPAAGTILYRFYYYKNGPNSGYSNEVSVTVNPLPTTPTAQVDRNNICSDDGGNISLSVTGGSGTTVRWFTSSCGGTDIGTGNPLVITAPISSTTYYARYENNCGNSTCSQVTLTVYPAPQITNPGNQTSCGDFTLPAITGTNLSGNEAYYTGSNGSGTQYNAGDLIANNSTLYIYDSNSGCTDEASFSITITRFNLIVSPNGASDCPDLSPATNPAFNPENTSYNHGATEVTFRIEPDAAYGYQSGWTFDFTLTGTVINTSNPSNVTVLTLEGDDTTAPTRTGTLILGSVNAGNNAYVDMFFQIENTPGSEQSINLVISNAGDGGSCGETEIISDNDAGYTIEAMPEVGAFN